MKKIVTTLAALALTVLPGLASADRTPANLRGFTSVCVNGSFAERDQEDEKVLTDLLGRVVQKLEAAGIQVQDNPCQPGGTVAQRQLNLFYTFETTQSGTVYSADLEGWLSRQDTLESVTIWDNGYFGELKGNGALKAADVLDTLLANFLADWRTAHPK
ncbi:hypothetical protein [Deinococcus aluminii]|uniref:Uncharacterized protein n=1 Tax=Deinococcus aluminii TaxID=1656885 RepID=A0ABP9XI82_9DEIO